MGLFGWGKKKDDDIKVTEPVIETETKDKEALSLKGLGRELKESAKEFWDGFSFAPKVIQNIGDTIGDKVEGAAIPLIHSAQINAATKRNEINAEKETEQEWKEDFERLGIKGTERTLLAKVWDGIKPLSLKIKDELKEKFEQDRTDDGTIMQNIGYNHNVRDISELVGDDDDPNSMYYRTKLAFQMGTEALKLYNDGEISSDTYNTFIKTNTTPIVNDFNSKVKSGLPSFDKDREYDFKDITKVMQIAETYRNKYEEKLSSEDYEKLIGRSNEYVIDEKTQAKIDLGIDNAGRANAKKEIQDTLDNVFNKLGNNFSNMPGMGGTFNGIKVTLDTPGFLYKALSQDLEKDATKYYLTVAQLAEELEKITKDIELNPKLADKKSPHYVVLKTGAETLQKMNDIIDYQREIKLAFMEYALLNMGTKGNTNTTEMIESFEKKTGYDMMDAGMTKASGTITFGATNQRIGDRISDLQKTFTIIAEPLTQKRAIKSIGKGDISEGLTQYGGSIYRQASDLISKARGSTVGLGVLSAVRGIQNVTDKEIDDWKEMVGYEAYKANDIRSSGNRRLASKLDNLLPGDGRTAGYFAVVGDAAPDIINGVALFLATRKIGLPNNSKVGKQLLTIEDAGVNYLDDMYRGIKNIASHSKEGASLNAATSKRGSQLVRGVKNSSFEKRLGAQMSARMFQQSVIMDSIFRQNATSRMTKDDIAISLIFAGTLDLLDVIKMAQSTRQFAKISAGKQLMKSDKFIDNLAKTMSGMKSGERGSMFKKINNMNFLGERSELTEAQKNVLRAKARGTISQTLGNLVQIKNGVDAKTRGYITKMMDDISDMKGMTEKLSQAGANTADEGYAELLRLDAERAAKESELRTRNAIDDKGSDTNKFFGMTKQDDGTYIYGLNREGLTLKITRNKDRHVNGYHVNNILQSNTDETVIDGINGFKIGDKNFSVEFTSKDWTRSKALPGKKESNFLYKDINIKDLSTNERHLGSIYIIDGSKNINLGIRHESGLKAILGDVNITKDTNSLKIKKPIHTIVEPKSTKVTDEITLGLEESIDDGISKGSLKTKGADHIQGEEISSKDIIKINDSNKASNILINKIKKSITRFKNEIDNIKGGPDAVNLKKDINFIQKQIDSLEKQGESNIKDVERIDELNKKIVILQNKALEEIEISKNISDIQENLDNLISEGKDIKKSKYKIDLFYDETNKSLENLLEKHSNIVKKELEINKKIKDIQKQSILSPDKTYLDTENELLKELEGLENIKKINESIDDLFYNIEFFGEGSIGRKKELDSLKKQRDASSKELKELKESYPNNLSVEDIQKQIDSLKKQISKNSEYLNIKNEELANIIKEIDERESLGKEYSEIGIENFNKKINNIKKIIDDASFNIELIKEDPTIAGKLELSKQLQENYKELGITKEESDTLTNIVYNNVGNEKGLIADINKSDLNNNLKNYFNDMSKYEDEAFMIKNAESKTYLKKYENSIKPVVDSFVNAGIPSSKINQAIELYLEGGEKNLRSRLIAAGIIDSSNKNSSKAIKTLFDNNINLTKGKNGSISDTYLQKNIREFKIGGRGKGIGLNSRKRVYDNVKESMLNFEKTKKFTNLKSEYDSIKSREKKSMFLNSRPEFKEELIKYWNDEKTINNILESTDITNTIWKNERSHELVDKVMLKRTEEISKEINMGPDFLSKNSEERLAEIHKRMGEATEDKLISVDEYSNWNQILDNYSKVLDKDNVNIMKADFSTVPPKNLDENVEQVKKLRDNEGRIIERDSKLLAAAENISEEEASALIKEELDNSIKEIDEDIKAWRDVLKIKDEVVLPNQKIMLNHSNEISRYLSAQPKDYIGEGYFFDSDSYRAILLKYQYLPDGTSLLKNLSKNREIIDGVKNVAKTEQFIKDLVSFRKGEEISLEGIINRKDYINKLRESDKIIRDMYNEISETVGAKYGHEFSNKIRSIGKNYDEDMLSKIGIMSEHGDWMEFIRYTDKDFYKSLRADQSLANSIWGKPSGAPKNIKPGLQGRYNRRWFEMFNVLSHDTATKKEIEVMSRYNDKLIQAQEWVKSGTGKRAKKYLEAEYKKNGFITKVSDTLDTIKDNRLYRIGRNLLKNLYVSSQTLLHPSQGIQLLIMNGQSTLIDPMVRGFDTYTNLGVQNIRKKYNLLVGPNEQGVVEGGILTQMRNGEVNLVKDIWKKDFWKKNVNRSLDNVGNITEDLSQVGAYNLVETSMDVNFRNDAVRKSIIDITLENDEKGFAEYMSKLSNEQREKVLQDIRLRANEHYTIRNAVQFNTAEGKFVYGSKYSVFGRVQKTAGWAYHFLGSRGNQHIRNYINLIKGGNIRLNKTFAELQATVGTLKAEELMQQYLRRNRDLVETFQKVVMSASIGDKLNQQTLDPDADQGFMDRISDAIKVGTMFYAGAQGLMSSPIGRNIYAAFEGVMLDNRYEQIELNDAMVGVMRGVEAMLSNAGRRTLMINSIVKGLAEAKINDEKGISKYLGLVFQNLITETEGYAYFLSDDVITSGIDQGMYQSNMSDIELLIPELNEYKNDWINMKSVLKFSVIEEKLKENRSKTIMNWITYYIPIYKKYAQGKLDTMVENGDLLREITELPRYNELASGILTIDDGDYEFANYIKTRLIESAPMNYQKKIKGDDGEYTGNAVTQWYDDFRQKHVSSYLDKNGKPQIKFNLQNKEDMFVKSLFDTIGTEKTVRLLEEFKRTDSDNIKAGIRLAGAIEAIGKNGGVIGASKTLIGAIASDVWREHYSDSRYEAGYKYGEEPDERKAQAEANADMFVAREFGDMLYVADKDAYSSIMFAYARKELPQYASKFSGGEITPGSEDDWMRTSPVGIIYEHGSIDKETGKETKYNDFVSTNLLKTRMYTSMEIANGNMNAVDWNNATNQLCGPKNASQAADPNYQRIALLCASEMASLIDNSNKTEQDKNNAKVGIALGMMPILSAAEDSSAFIEAIGLDNIHDAKAFVYGTSLESQRLKQDVIMHEAQRSSFKNLQKGGYVGPDKKTGTVLDDYNIAGNYYSNYFATDPIGSYKKNSPSYSKLKSYAQKLGYIPKISESSYSGSSSKRNTPMSKYLDYYYRFIDVKSGNVGIGEGRNQVGRAFTGKKTKLFVKSSQQ